MNDSWPRDARVSDDDRTKYTELTESGDSPFETWERNELFVFAAAYGYDQGLKTELEATNHALFNWDSLTDSQLWVLKSIAVEESADPDVLDEGGEIDQVAREYANGGINRLYQKYTGTDDLFAKLTEDAITIADI